MTILFMNDDLHLIAEGDGAYRVICVRELSLEVEYADDAVTRVRALPLSVNAAAAKEPAAATPKKPEQPEK